MPIELNPNDPYQRDIGDNDVRRSAANDIDLQRDAEGPAGGSRIAVFAVAIAVVLGAVFYGLNNSSTTAVGNGTSTASQTSRQDKTAAQTSDANRPPVAPGVRDVTPSNNQPGMTTGAAPAQPAPASPAPANPGSAPATK